MRTNFRFTVTQASPCRLSQGLFPHFAWCRTIIFSGRRIFHRIPGTRRGSWSFTLENKRNFPPSCLRGTAWPGAWGRPVLVSRDGPTSELGVHRWSYNVSYNGDATIADFPARWCRLGGHVSGATAGASRGLRVSFGGNRISRAPAFPNARVSFQIRCNRVILSTIFCCSASSPTDITSRGDGGAAA